MKSSNHRSMVPEPAASPKRRDRGKAVDSDLDRRWLGGESHALSDAHERYRRRLEGVAYRIVRNRADAEDVVQRVFQALPSACYRGDASLWSYLYRAAVNASVTVLRSRQRRSGLQREFEARAEVERREEPGPEDRLLEGELLAAVARALLCVKPRHRRVLIMHINHGLTNSEIARQEGVPVATIGTWLRRGREELRIALAPLLRDTEEDEP